MTGVDKLLLSAEEAAWMLGTSRSTVYRLLRERELGSIRVGGLRRIPTTALVAFVQRLSDDAQALPGQLPPRWPSPTSGGPDSQQSSEAVDAPFPLSPSSSAVSHRTKSVRALSPTTDIADRMSRKPAPRRRPNGYARPYLDKSKRRWYQVVAVDGQRRKVSGATKEDVAVLAEQVRSRLVAGNRIVHDHHRTVGQLLDYWSAEVAAERVRESTLDSYQRTIRLYLKPILGKIRLTALAFDDVEHMQQVLVRQGKASQTVLQARKVLSAALKWAVKKGWTAANAVTNADMPVGTNAATVTRHLDAIEFGRLRKQLEGDRLQCAYLLCCYLGLRRGEVLGLLWPDIDLELRRIMISRQLRRATTRGPNGRTNLVLARPKTQSSARALRLPECAVDAILRHTSLQRLEREQADSWSTQPLEGDLVFTSLSRDGKRGGSPVDVDNFGHRLLLHAQAAGVEHLSPHGLRHTGVSFLYNDGGVDMKAISEWAGHANEYITSSVYVHMTQRKRDQVADRMDAVVASLCIPGSTP
jgi:excisionase family DNA binding protein